MRSLELVLADCGGLITSFMNPIFLTSSCFLLVVGRGIGRPGRCNIYIILSHISEKSSISNSIPCSSSDCIRRVGVY